MPAAVHTATLGSLSLKQITDSNVSWNGQPIFLSASGANDASEILGGPGQYGFTFTTEDVGGIAAVSGIGTSGIAVDGGTIEIPYQVRADLSTFAGAGGHFKINATKGLILLDSINFPSGGGNATASLSGNALSSSGTTDPVTLNAVATLAAETPNAIYTFAKAVVNGTEITQFNGGSLTAGVSVDSPIYSGNFATEAFIGPRRPVIDLNTYNLAALVALGGTWAVGTSVVVYLRKRSGAGFVPDATAAHIAISFADGLVAPAQTITGAGVGGNSSRAIRFYGETLVVTGSSAIP